MANILTLKTHGYVGTGYNQEVNTLNESFSSVVSLNGLPFWQDVVLDGWRLPFEPILTVTGSKIIQKTTITGSGRRGTVKELICDGDYRITLQGMFIGENGYPLEDMNRLNTIINKQSSVEFQSVITDIFGIEKVVIEKPKFPHTKGVKNQAYRLDLTSDIDFLAEIKLSDL